MKEYYYLKTLTTYTVRDVVNQAFHTFKRLGLESFKGTAIAFIAKYNPTSREQDIYNLDAPSEFRVREGVADTLQNFCDEQGFILRQIKTTKRGACVSFWITKRVG